MCIFHNLPYSLWHFWLGSWCACLSPPKRLRTPNPFYKIKHSPHKIVEIATHQLKHKGKVLQCTHWSQHRLHTDVLFSDHNKHTLPLVFWPTTSSAHGLHRSACGRGKDPSAAGPRGLRGRVRHRRTSTGQETRHTGSVWTRARWK